MRVREVTDAGVNELTAADVGTAVAAGGGLVWMDLDHTDQQGMALLPLLFDVRAADIEDCHVRTPVPKLHLYTDHHYPAINGLARGVDEPLHGRRGGPRRRGGSRRSWRGWPSSRSCWPSSPAGTGGSER